MDSKSFQEYKEKRDDTVLHQAMESDSHGVNECRF